MDATIRIKQLKFYLQQVVEICNELTRGKVYKVTMMPYHWAPDQKFEKQDDGKRF